MAKKKTYKYNASWGETYDISFHVDKYHNNGSLAIIMMDETDKEEFSILTVNLPQSKLFADFAPNTQFVDTNNLPDIDKWLEEIGVAKPTSHKGCSGFCTYPAYEFDLTKM